MKAKEIVLSILTMIEVDEPPASVSEIAVKVLIGPPTNFTLTIAQALVETNKKAIERIIRTQWNTHGERGQPLRLTLFETTNGDYLIRGSCHVFPTDSSIEVDAKRRRKTSLQITEILKTISDPNDLERLCVKILGLLGVSSPVLTRAARDEGIDFFGKINPIAEKYYFDVTPTVQKSLDIWLVGQAKHYPSGKAGTPDLRHLFGSVALARANAFSTNSFTAKTLILRVADPVFCLFFTTGQLSNDAWTLAKATGIVAMDGSMLSAFLADRDLNDTIVDPSEFRKWLDS